MFSLDRKPNPHNASKININSVGTAILFYLYENKGATKYDVVTNVLKQTGTNHQLRGYYCGTFQSWRENGIVKLDRRTHKYSLTKFGLQCLKEAMDR